MRLGSGAAYHDYHSGKGARAFQTPHSTVDPFSENGHRLTENNVYVSQFWYPLWKRTFYHPHLPKLSGNCLGAPPLEGICCNLRGADARNVPCESVMCLHGKYTTLHYTNTQNTQNTQIHSPPKNTQIHKYTKIHKKYTKNTQKYTNTQIHRGSQKYTCSVFTM